MTDFLDKLKAARMAELEIKAHIEHIESLHRIMRLPRSKEYAERTVEKLAALEAELNRLIDEAADRKSEAITLLQPLPADERTALYQYYILAKDWHKVADEMYLCERSVFYLRKKAMTSLETKNGKNSFTPGRVRKAERRKS